MGGRRLRVLRRRRVQPGDRRLARRGAHARPDGPRRPGDGPRLPRARLGGLVAHTDAGSQFTSARWAERIGELGAAPSVRTVGDSYDNALAETVNGLHKTEPARGPTGGPRRSVGDVEPATLAWVHWHNTQRLHGHLDDIPPAEYEAAHAAQRTDHTLVGNQ